MCHQSIYSKASSLLLSNKMGPLQLSCLLNSNNQRFYLQKMNSSPTFYVFMAIMLLLHHPVAALNWQGTGEMTNDNLTVIWDYIHKNLKRNFDASTIPLFNTALSQSLNDLWAPAWNIVTVTVLRATNYNDVILYGYAFRNHWMWFNGYTDPQIIEAMFSFVIWKDYNCKDWRTIGVDAPEEDRSSGFIQGQKEFISAFISSSTSVIQVQNDPWSLLKTIIDSVQASSLFVTANNHAYSAVLSQQSYQARMYGRVCVVDRNFYYSPFDYGNGAFGMDNQYNGYGSLMLFQTR